MAERGEEAAGASVVVEADDRQMAPQLHLPASSDDHQVAPRPQLPPPHTETGTLPVPPVVTCGNRVGSRVGSCCSDPTSTPAGSQNDMS